MSKGKRKSDPEALKIVRDRLRCRHQARFTEQDRALLGKLCRTDLIEIIERDLALGPLRASQKNSVASMVHWLLRWQLEEDEFDADEDEDADDDENEIEELEDNEDDDIAAAVGRDQGPVAASTPSGPAQQDRRTDSAVGTTDHQQCPSSAGGSCHTPSMEEDQQDQRLQLQRSGCLTAAGATATGNAAAAAATYPGQPWLAELEQQLEAAGNVCTMQADSTDTDEDAGTEADSGWMQSQSGMTVPFSQGQPEQQQPQFSAAGAAAGAGAGAGAAPPAPAAAGAVGMTGSSNQHGLDISQIEEQLLQQLLLDIEAKPKQKSKLRRGLSVGEQQQQQLQLMLMQQQQQQQQQQQLQLQQQQLLLQAQLQQQLQQLNLEQLLRDELVQQIQQHTDRPMAEHDPQPPQQQQQCASSSLQPPLEFQAAAAAAAPGSFTRMQQLPQQMATWPLAGMSSTAEAAAAGGGSGLLPLGGLGSAGMVLENFSDGPLHVSSRLWRQGSSRLSCEGAGNSFMRKRDKMLRELPAMCDGGLSGYRGAAADLVQQSGPSADVPTKRMSVTLPGSNNVASLPTSFSGRVGSVAGMTRPVPGDLQQLMQFSSFDNACDMQWQQQELLQQQQQQQFGGAGGTGVSGFANKLKTLLRGKKTKAKRYHSVGAGGSFSNSLAVAAAGGAGRVASAEAAVAAGHGTSAHPGSMTAVGPCVTTPGPAVPWSGRSQTAMGQQAESRLWQSVVTVPNPFSGDPHMLPATVGGLSWHAEKSTLLSSTSMSTQPPQLAPCAAARGTRSLMAAPSGVAAADSQFAQQLAQLRALYGSNPGAAMDVPAAAAADQACMPPPMGCVAALDAGRSSAADASATESLARSNSNKSGFVGKLVRAFKLQSSPSLAALAAGGDLAQQEYEEEDDTDLLLTGRCNGELDLTKAVLDWHRDPDSADVWGSIRGLQHAPTNDAAAAEVAGRTGCLAGASGLLGGSAELAAAFDVSELFQE